ncbi:hypothetical protein CDEF62S_01969 [Castellaniella defragrans]
MCGTFSALISNTCRVSCPRAARPRFRSLRPPCCISAAGARASMRRPIRNSTPSFTKTSPKRMARSCTASTRQGAATCRWTTPTWRICATATCARRPASAATIPTNCRTAMRHSSIESWRISPRTWSWPCICAEATSKAPMQPKATTSRWPRRCCPRCIWTPTSWNTTTIAAGISGPCDSCPKARSWCWAW